LGGFLINKTFKYKYKFLNTTNCIVLFEKSKKMKKPIKIILINHYNYDYEIVTLRYNRKHCSIPNRFEENETL